MRSAASHTPLRQGLRTTDLRSLQYLQQRHRGDQLNRCSKNCPKHATSHLGGRDWNRPLELLSRHPILLGLQSGPRILPVLNLLGSRNPNSEPDSVRVWLAVASTLSCEENRQASRMPYQIFAITDRYLVFGTARSSTLIGIFNAVTMR